MAREKIGLWMQQMEMRGRGRGRGEGTYAKDLGEYSSK